MSDKPNYRHTDYAIRDRILNRLRNAKTIRTVCAWCGVLIHDGELTVDGHESHGACSTCAKQWLKDARLPVEGE